MLVYGKSKGDIWDNGEDIVGPVTQLKVQVARCNCGNVEKDALRRAKIHDTAIVLVNNAAHKSWAPCGPTVSRVANLELERYKMSRPSTLT